jgi:GDP-4-dehydro-6-deoxy-D-mannose reductase
MRVFITGVDSFIGSHLAGALREAGHEVFGLSRRAAGTRDGVTLSRGSIVDEGFILRAVRECRPDRVFHLAAQSKIAYSFAHPQETVSVNVVGTINLLEAVRAAASGAFVVSVGSSAEYGRVAAAVEYIREDQALDPTSPYGVSKVSQGLIGSVYAKVHGLRLVHVRPFAIIGPGKEGDALSDFCRRIVEIEAGSGDALSVGNLEAARDFVDVRDCVTALLLVSEKGRAGETYNICNSRAATLRELVQVLQEVSARPFSPTFDPGRLRPADDPRIVGDNAKLRALGYRPRFTLAETVRDTLRYWRKERR